MPYITNINAPKARGDAMKLLIQEQLPVGVVALRMGVNRSTVWRWRRKWQELNANVQMDNPNRPSRKIDPAGCVPGVGPVSKFRLEACTWNIPTLSSCPRSNSKAIPEHIVQAVMKVRDQLNRCAEVVWHYVNNKLGLRVSLSSVRRILRRHHYFDGARRPRLKKSNPKRPPATAPGELVQTDTIHYVCPYTYKRKYVYTVIDLYTRTTYARASDRIAPGEAAKAVLEAREYFRGHSTEHFNFDFSMVQSDNGPEFGRYFEQTLAKHNILTRHSRLGRPNDNAHIERFNRTLQDECTGRTITSKDSVQKVQTRLTSYLDFYNNHRVHLGIQLRTLVEMLHRF